MPQFFDHQTLTDEQKARWDWAVAQYEQVQDGNIRRYIDRMDIEDKRALFKEEHPEVSASQLADISLESLDAFAINRQKRFNRLFANEPGHTKSALFARLLNGHLPLPEPPPTAFSYPWYEIVEKAGVYPVTVYPDTREEEDREWRRIVLNQCGWEIIDTNPAAESLLALEQELHKEGGRAGILEKLNLAYRNEPEMTVRFGPYGPFRLFLAKATLSGSRSSALRSVDAEDLSSVFDMDEMRLEGRILKTLHKGEHPVEALEKLRNSNSRYPKMIQMFVEQSEETLEADIRRYEADPTAGDTVQFEYAVWHLEAKCEVSDLYRTGI